MFAVKLAVKDLRGAVARLKILILCLALGVAALAAIGTVRATLERAILTQGATLLGGDAEIAFSYRTARADELAWIDANAKAVQHLVDFRSLATAGGQSALSRVKAVDSAYPLTGALRLAPAIPLADALNGRGAVIDAAMAARLNLRIGDRFSLGGAEFTLRSLIDYMPDQLGGGFNMAPHVVVALPDLEGTGLMAEGTIFTARYRMLLDPKTDLAALESAARTAMDGSGLQWRDRRNAAPRIALFIERLGNFLILVGLSGLFVGGVGIFAAVQSFIASKTRSIAILRAMGATDGQLFTVFFLQIMVLSGVGTVIGLALGAAIPLALFPALEAQFPFELQATVPFAALGHAAGFGMVSSVLFAIWPLAGALRVKPTALLRGSGDAATPANGPRLWLVIGGLVALLYLLAVWNTQAPMIALWAFAGLMGAQMFLLLAGVGLQTLLARLRRLLHRAGPLSWAVAAIATRRAEARAIMLSLGLGLSVLAAIGQIDGNLQRAVAVDMPAKAPAFFLVDIQPHQKDPLFADLRNTGDVSRIDTAPMLRGIITHINDIPVQDWGVEHWVLRGDRGISYAAAPPDGTVISKGTWWPDDYAGPPQISFAAEEAAELGLDLGDQITVNILGRPIMAQITSLRDVDFSTAGIGFVMILSPQPIANAPHSSIATLYAPPSAEAGILRALARDYPTITAIPVREAIDRARDIMTSIAMAIRYGAGAALLTGVLVLIGTAAAGQAARIYEAAVLRALGATRAAILWSFALRAGILGAGAGLVALICGSLGAWAVMRFVMDSGFQIIWWNAAGIIMGGIVASLLASMWFALSSFNMPPAQVLRHKE